MVTIVVWLMYALCLYYAQNALLKNLRRAIEQLCSSRVWAICTSNWTTLEYVLGCWDRHIISQQVCSTRQLAYLYNGSTNSNSECGMPMEGSWCIDRSREPPTTKGNTIIKKRQYQEKKAKTKKKEPFF